MGSNPNMKQIHYNQYQNLNNHKQTKKQNENVQNKNLSKYWKSRLIGQGTYGKVYESMNLQTGLILQLGIKYAMKVINLKSTNREDAIKEINNLKSEIYIFKKLYHPNIIKFEQFEIAEDKKSVSIIMQYAYKSIADIIKKYGKITQKVASILIRQVLQALHYLHSQKIIHRDLKCSNILITKQNIVKLTDFGTAKILQNNCIEDNIAQKSKSLKGTPYWMAPEVLKRTGHDMSADIWSIGCILIQMLSGKPPWYGLSNDFRQIIKIITSGKIPPYPINISEFCEKFLNSCLKTDATKRLKVWQLLNHQYIRKYQKIESKNIRFEIDCNIKHDLNNLQLSLIQHQKKYQNKKKFPQTYQKQIQQNNIYGFKYYNYYQ